MNGDEVVMNGDEVVMSGDEGESAGCAHRVGEASAMNVITSSEGARYAME